MGDGNESFCSEHHDRADTSIRECFCGSAYQMVRDFSSGERRFFFSKGQFSLVDLAVALTHQTGAVAFQCAVWTGTKASIDSVANLVESQRVSDARWIICDSQRDMNEDRLSHIVRTFGVESVRVTPLHAKIMTLHNDDWSIVVQSSANMTKNRSVEQFDVTDSRKLFDFVDRWFDDVFESHPTLAEESPFDGWSYEEVESRYQSMCVGGHFEKHSSLDASPIGVSDGIS